MFFQSPIPAVYIRMFEICFNSLQHPAAATDHIFLVAAYSAMIDITNALVCREESPSYSGIIEMYHTLWGNAIEDLKAAAMSTAQLSITMKHIHGTCNELAVLSTRLPSLPSEIVQDAVGILFSNVSTPNCLCTSDAVFAISYILSAVSSEERSHHFDLLLNFMTEIFQTQDLQANEVLLQLLIQLSIQVNDSVAFNWSRIFELVYPLFVTPDLLRFEIYPPLIACFARIVILHEFNPSGIENFWENITMRYAKAILITLELDC